MSSRYRDRAPRQSREQGRRLVRQVLGILDATCRGYQDSRMVLDSQAILPLARATAIGLALVDAEMVAGVKRTIKPPRRVQAASLQRTLRPAQLEPWSARLTGTEPSSTSSTSCTSTDPRADPPASRRSLVWADLKREARALLGASLTRHLGCAAGRRSPAADAGGRRP